VIQTDDLADRQHAQVDLDQPPGAGPGGRVQLAVYRAGDDEAFGPEVDIHRPLHRSEHGRDELPFVDQRTVRHAVLALTRTMPRVADLFWMLARPADAVAVLRETTGTISENAPAFELAAIGSV
jgi:hypothetical protein